MKKEAKEKQKEYEEKLQKKNKLINDLLTESENKKTEFTNLQNSISMKRSIEVALQQQVDKQKEILEQKVKDSEAQ